MGTFDKVSTVLKVCCDYNIHVICIAGMVVVWLGNVGGGV